MEGIASSKASMMLERVGEEGAVEAADGGGEEVFRPCRVEEAEAGEVEIGVDGGLESAGH